ncbi:MAG: glycosyltransferase family 2 protein [Opitutae bacterium]|nr:glycosyltransferase family 2 protein [Opitutae bacterium]
MTPSVSIIIPCHNAGRWLAETIQSALGQTWPDKEIILVDDGSTDGSLAVARQSEAQGVRVVSQPNAGAAAARNAGLARASGDFIQFLDADDLLAPDKIERQVRLLQERGAGCIATCAWGRFTTDPAAGALDTGTALWRDLAPADWLVLAAEHNLMMATATWLLPRALADRIGPWNTEHRANPLDDMDYFDRARAAAHAVLFCPATRAYYRSEIGGSLSRVRSDEAWRAISATLHRSADLLLKLEDSPRTRRAAATMLQRFIYELYPACPELAAAAAGRVRQLGGSDLRPEFGPARRALAKLVGWKLTKRLHDLTR